MKKYIISLVIILITGILAHSQSYKVIVNNSNSTASITKTELSNLFLKKHNKWRNNSEAIPLDLGTKSSIREAFSKDIHKKTIAQVRAFWQQSVFSGKATPPAEMDSDAKVIDFVKSNSGAIGYVSASANTNGVKTITVN